MESQESQRLPRIIALYRHPVKGFTPEQRESLTVMPNGRVSGDRVLVFRYADAPQPNELGWMPKANYAVLSNTPGVAKAKLHFDEARQRLSIDFGPGAPGVAEAGLDEEGRRKLAQAVASFALAQEFSPLHGHPEKLPLRLVGDMDREHFHDSAEGRVTLFSRESLCALGEALHDPDMDGRRFRANIVIEGVSEWAELGWAGKRVRIGRLDFEAVKPVVRCVATHANPVTGERDCDVMNTLTRVFGHEKPSFAVSLECKSGGGVVHVGDEVTVAG
ncbi:MAG: MOSC domain-containing protein [Dehalococcoidia bacterium]|nr:MOSC domain-containing protein [Dehalococcoidia bacterium]MSQ35124.1 MOSC domain-containing protein [Dehalococcoidia bacterium]